MPVLSKDAEMMKTIGNCLDAENYSFIDKEGNTLLHLIAKLRGGDLKTHLTKFFKEWLQDKGIHLNAVNQEGETALHLLCENQNYDLARFIIKNGADISIRDKSGSNFLHKFTGPKISSSDETVGSSEFVDFVLAYFLEEDKKLKKDRNNLIELLKQENKFGLTPLEGMVFSGDASRVVVFAKLIGGMNGSESPDEILQMTNKKLIAKFKDYEPAGSFDQNIKIWKKMFNLHSIREIFFPPKNILFPLFLYSKFTVKQLFREAAAVDFSEEHAPIIQSKYEKNLYKGAAEHEETIIPYRAVKALTYGYKPILDESGLWHFFKSSSHNIINDTLYEQIKEKLAELHIQNFNLSLLPVALLHEQLEKISTLSKGEYQSGLMDISKKPDRNFNYILVPILTHNHFIFLVAIMDNKKEEEKLKSLIFCNALDAGEKTIKYIKSQIKLPLMDISLPIQKKIFMDMEDENCAIYMLDLSVAFAKTVDKNEKLKTRLEKNISGELDKGICKDISESLKEHLPMYYTYNSQNKSYQFKDPSSVKVYFRERRWDLSTAYLKGKKFQPE